MDQIVNDVRKRHWLEIIQQCNRQCSSDGLTKKEWCARNGIVTKTFYYHQKQLRQELALISAKQENGPAEESHQVTFAEVEMPVAEQSVPPQTSAIDFRPDAVIQTRTLKIEVSNRASSELLSMLGAVIRNAT